MDINLARTLANIAERAKTLWADGYTYIHDDGLITIKSPEFNFYHVNLDSLTCYTREPGGKREDCPSYAKYGTCKHLQAAVATPEARDWAVCREYERMEDGETAEGCDPYSIY